MTDSRENARLAALKVLQEIDASLPLSAEDAGRATSAYLRSLIRDGDVGYLVELFSENSDANLLKLYGLIAQSIQDRQARSSDAVGNYMGDMIGSYLTAEVEAAIEMLPTLNELARDEHEQRWELS